MMKKHLPKVNVLYTNLIVGDIFPRSVVRNSSNHHERPDGSGYPNEITGKELTLQDRVLQVADVTSALLQKHSYKRSLDKDVVIQIRKEDAEAGKPDADIVGPLIK